MVYSHVLDVCCIACVFYFLQVSQPRMSLVFTHFVNGDAEKKKEKKCRNVSHYRQETMQRADSLVLSVEILGIAVTGTAVPQLTIRSYN